MKTGHFEMSEPFFNTIRDCVLATSEKAPDFLGVPVLVSKLMPKNEAWLLDSSGKIVQIFYLEG